MVTHSLTLTLISCLQLPRRYWIIWPSARSNSWATSQWSTKMSRWPITATKWHWLKCVSWTTAPISRCRSRCRPVASARSYRSHFHSQSRRWSSARSPTYTAGTLRWATSPNEACFSARHLASIKPSDPSIRYDFAPAYASRWREHAHQQALHAAACQPPSQ